MELLIIMGLGALIAKAISSGSGSSSTGEGDSQCEHFSHDGYAFELRDVGGQWRAYILNQPSYLGRDAGAHATHRLSDGRGQYVCWSRSIGSKAECRAIAEDWARQTDQYIRTGGSFS